MNGFETLLRQNIVLGIRNLIGSLQHILAAM
jgi:hypothetical protein